MSIGPQLRTYLLADTSIAATIGTRVYPIRLPQKPILPAITYLKVSGLRHYKTTGPQNLSRPRMQIDCWALTYDEAMSLDEAVRQRLEGYAGTMGTKTVQGTFFENEREFYESEAELYRRSRDYFVWFEE